ncbi:MAG: hypothetical protein HQK77_18355 [Desulfobacterales bacterium]|nr:hypothetical protein [Desulfobacterales bacterium]
MWHHVNQVTQYADNEFRGSVELPKDSLWFSGHFPDDPILPGVAQVGMVLNAIQQLHKRPLKILKISRVRFKQIIRPEDSLMVILKQFEGKLSYSFQIIANDNVACTGIMDVDINPSSSV